MYAIHTKLKIVIFQLINILVVSEPNCPFPWNCFPSCCCHSAWSHPFSNRTQNYKRLRLIVCFCTIAVTYRCSNPARIHLVPGCRHWCYRQRHWHLSLKQETKWKLSIKHILTSKNRNWQRIIGHTFGVHGAVIGTAGIPSLFPCGQKKMYDFELFIWICCKEYVYFVLILTNHWQYSCWRLETGLGFHQISPG